MRGVRGTDAHKTDHLAELVCSNSFRSDDATEQCGRRHPCRNADGRLADHGLRRRHQVPAGGALAVDRDGFSAAVTKEIDNHPLITVVREEVHRPAAEGMGSGNRRHRPADRARSLASAIQAETGADALAFFDAIAPIVYRESIDMDICWYQSRYDKVGPGGTGKDYINCPMDEAQYNAFVDALIAGDTVGFKEWEGTPYFDGCLPIEIMAERGRETLRHGPMKPMGLTNEHNPTVKAYAVVQLRQDNALGTLYNMVGFQTKLKYGAQADIFRMIPGPAECRVRSPRRPASQHLHQFADAARPLR
jgi:methylenetetrahydrofolate--tRNA-(uracil-5-)-methyltransferase